jgi:penicillin-insensitive murein DD-endopeptidase
MRIAALFLGIAIGCVLSGSAMAQDNVAEEAAHRAALLAQLPPDAAQRVFGLETTPAPGRAQAIGAYERGCLDGAVELPADGPNWQVMRPSRDRAWGHPVLIAFIERLSAKLAAAAGWPGFLIGDIAQPRGGPMLTGHGSHQIGLDADIWLTPMPNRRLTPAERDEMSATGRRRRWSGGEPCGVEFILSQDVPRGGARARRGADLRQPGDQARIVP